MGMFDTVMVPCPRCGEKYEFQTKGGRCLLENYELDEAPIEVLDDVNRNSPVHCRKCSIDFVVGIEGMNQYAAMEKGEAEKAMENMTHRDFLATHIRAGVKGVILEAARRFGMENDLRQLAIDVSTQVVHSIYEIDPNVVDRRHKELVALLDRQRAERDEHQKKFMAQLDEAQRARDQKGAKS